MAAERNSIGVEIDPAIVDLALANIASESQKLNNIVDARLKEHIAFIEGLPREKYEKCYENPKHQFKVKTKQETAIIIDHLSAIDMDRNVVTCAYQ